MVAGSLICVLLLTAGVWAQKAELPGKRADGSILLSNGWSLQPEGKQVPLESDLPIRMSREPGTDLVAIQHAGYRKHAVVIFDPAREKVVAEFVLPRSWSGMAWGLEGKRLFVSGGVDDRVHVLELEHGAKGKISLQALDQWSVGNPKILDLPAGLCAAPGGGLYIPLQRSSRIVHLDAKGKPLFDRALRAGSYPFECILSRDGKRLFVSLWAHKRVVVLDAKTGQTLGGYRAGLHPSSLLLSPEGDRLFVSNAAENSVTVVDLEAGRVQETMNCALYPNAPPGSTPNALALDPRGKILLVANADNNNLAVFDVSVPGKGRSLGFIPVGWYPTAVLFSPTGEVLVANGKGSTGSRANAKGPRPTDKKRVGMDQYIGAMFQGSLSSFAFPSPTRLGELSKRSLDLSPLDGQGRRRVQRPADSPIPATPGDKGPMRYCVYIIKENRTYDQVLGDIEKGNGDKSLCLFPRKVTPNHHAIAESFVLLDNFYVESEVSADGHEWTMGAYATDFVERTWPVKYGGKDKVRLEGGKRASLGYPSEGIFDIATPKNGYLFDLAERAGISYRSYGEFVGNPSKGRRGKPGQPAKPRLASLVGHCDPWFPGYNLAITDQARADRFLEELAGFEKKGDLPQLIVLRLPNDHTAGTSVGRPTPRAYVADNDLALGRVIEGLSKTRFWKQMCVFVVEDDAQNGPDHVDAHRTVAFLAGPYVRRGAVVSEMYSTSSMLRTMELILGLPPMSQFDAAALPMYACFQNQPDLSPYELVEASWPLEEKNKKTAYGAERSKRMNFATEDAMDDLELNEILWKSIMGVDSPCPAPVRAAFIRKIED